jgi:hypothetical protein
MSLIISHLQDQPYELKKIQILDFYFLFPGLLKYIKLPNELRLYKSYLNRIKDPYTYIDDPRKIITHLEHQIIEVTHYLASYGMINVERLKDNIIQRINSEKYNLVIEKIIEYDKELLKFLTSVLVNIPLKELKSRTNLFESRYDYE